VGQKELALTLGAREGRGIVEAEVSGEDRACGKGIRKALRDVLGHLAVVQRCTVHKRRNVRDHLPLHRQTSVDGQIRDAYASPTADLARKRLRQVIFWLERNDEHGAAEILKEGLDETLTVLKLKLPLALQKFSSR
jgi:transposase-like protein